MNNVFRSAGTLSALTLALTLSASPAASAVPGDPAAPASAAPSTSSSAAPGAADLPPLSGRDWPRTSSDRPSEADWQSAERFRTEGVMTRQSPWAPQIHDACTVRAIREWVRITCSSEETLFGVAWGRAGNLEDAKVSFTPASTLPRIDKLGHDRLDELQRVMAADASATFPLRPGTALLLSIDEMGVDDDYNGPFVFTRPGVQVDASWAAGEERPVILLHG